MTLYDISDPASELFTEKVDYFCAKFLTWDPKFVKFPLAFVACFVWEKSQPEQEKSQLLQ